MGSGCGYVVDVIIPLCSNGSSVNLSSYTLSMYVYLDGDPYPAADKSSLYTVGTDPSMWADTGPLGTTITTGAWIQLKGILTGNGSSTALGLHLAPSPAQWNGTLYIDDVQLTAP